jgi:hypothetical protein
MISFEKLTEAGFDASFACVEGAAGAVAAGGFEVAAWSAGAEVLPEPTVPAGFELV